MVLTGSYEDTMGIGNRAGIGLWLGDSNGAVHYVYGHEIVGRCIGPDRMTVLDEWLCMQEPKFSRVIASTLCYFLCALYLNWLFSFDPRYAYKFAVSAYGIRNNIHISYAKMERSQAICFSLVRRVIPGSQQMFQSLSQPLIELCFRCQT